MRIYDPRLGQFLSVDPIAKAYPWYTPYQFAGNRPINSIDLDGLEEKEAFHYTKIGGNTITRAVDAKNIYNMGNGVLTHYYQQIEVSSRQMNPGSVEVGYKMLYLGSMYIEKKEPSLLERFNAWFGEKTKNWQIIVFGSAPGTESFAPKANPDGKFHTVNLNDEDYQALFMTPDLLGIPYLRKDLKSKDWQRVPEIISKIMDIPNEVANVFKIKGDGSAIAGSKPSPVFDSVFFPHSIGVERDPKNQKIKSWIKSFSETIRSGDVNTPDTIRKRIYEDPKN